MTHKNKGLIYTTKHATDSRYGWRPVSSIIKTKNSDSDGSPWYRVGRMISKQLGDFINSDMAVQNRQGLDGIGSILSNPGVSVNIRCIFYLRVLLSFDTKAIVSQLLQLFSFRFQGIAHHRCYRSSFGNQYI